MLGCLVSHLWPVVSYIYELGCPFHVGILGVCVCTCPCISDGNLLLLNEALSKHETFFIRCGIFLILEKLKIITYRNLFKKVWASSDLRRATWAEGPAKLFLSSVFRYLLLKTHQLPLDTFLVALKMMKVDDVDVDEVQCILANLIYMVSAHERTRRHGRTREGMLTRFLCSQGHIKGYISHQHQKLVVSKQNPFPPLSSVS